MRTTTRRVIDMTIDETIAMMHEWADYECYNEEQIQASEAFNQIAVLLEELKDYRDKNKMVVRVDCENMNNIKDKTEELTRYAESQYNKAIDDFAEKLNAKCDRMIKEKWNSNVAPISWAEAYADFKDDIDDISEQLKVGVTND